MNKLHVELKLKLEEYLSEKGLKNGPVPISLEELSHDFASFAKTLPVNKRSLGRELAQRFYKKQIRTGPNREFFLQHYFFNKKI